MFKKTLIQQQALKLLAGKSRHILLFGGSRSGKTFILVYSILVRALKAAGSRHIILRYRANSVRQSIRMDTFNKVLKLAFPNLKFYENRLDGCITLPNCSEIWFGGLDNDDRSDRILGKEFATIYFNECSEINFDSVNTALTRLAQKTTLVNKAYYDCNPSGKSHWSYKLFIEKIDPVTNLPLSNKDLYSSMLMNPADNIANLPSDYVTSTLENLNEKQRKRFLLGEWCDEDDLGLWNTKLINDSRLAEVDTSLRKIIIGVDPAVTNNLSSDLTGIIVAALGENGHFYILEDASLKANPTVWVKKIIDKYHQYNAVKVVCEVNNGGDLIGELLKSMDNSINFRQVRADKSKIARAELILSLYEQKKVHHVGFFRELEDQMCSYNEKISKYSPDRLDALVWALTNLNAKQIPLIIA
ncbi:MAG: phage terminase large subunit [Lentisphaeria bacterium]|nr:phage terminase large subunit [Lentisphaeria bacterium]